MTDEERYREEVRKFYEAYNQLKKKMSVRMHAHSDVYGNNFIKIYEYEGDRQKRLVMKAEEDDDIELHKRATELIESLIKNSIQMELDAR